MSVLEPLRIKASGLKIEIEAFRFQRRPERTGGRAERVQEVIHSTPDQNGLVCEFSVECQAETIARWIAKSIGHCLDRGSRFPARLHSLSFSPGSFVLDGRLRA